MVFYVFRVVVGRAFVMDEKELKRQDEEELKGKEKKKIKETVDGKNYHSVYIT